MLGPNLIDRKLGGPEFDTSTAVCGTFAVAGHTSDISLIRG